MPIYEYTCAKCKKVTEILQKISEKSKSKCPTCGGKLSKLMSESAFHLKGSGWYKTDYVDKKEDMKSDDTATQKTDKKDKIEEKKSDKKAEKPKKESTKKNKPAKS